MVPYKMNIYSTVLLLHTDTCGTEFAVLLYMPPWWWPCRVRNMWKGDEWQMIIYCLLCCLSAEVQYNHSVARNVGYVKFWSVQLDVDGRYANEMPFTLQTPVVPLCATEFNIQKFYVLFAPYFFIIFVMDLSTKGGYWLTGLLWFYNGDRVFTARYGLIFKRTAP